MNLTIHTFHRDIQSNRFDPNFRIALFDELSSKYTIKWENHDGADRFVYKNGGDMIQIDDGSVIIFEIDEKIKMIDLGDYCKYLDKISEFKNFERGIAAQFNSRYWKKKFGAEQRKIFPGVLYETHWEFGKNNYEYIQHLRQNSKLNDSLHWRGTIYNGLGNVRYDGCRDSIPLIKNILGDRLSFNPGRVGFVEYIMEASNYTLALGFGGGGGYTCGDFCFRDIEMFGLGIPLLRPKYAIEVVNNLVPNFHYISVDIDDCLTAEYRIEKSKEQEVAHRIATRYDNVIRDKQLLNEIAMNAKLWYENNLTRPYVVTNTIKALDL